MKMINLKCPNCGSTLHIEDEKETITCEYCKAELKIDKEDKHITIDNAETFGYEFEKGRYKAQNESNKEEVVYEIHGTAKLELLKIFIGLVILNSVYVIMEMSKILPIGYVLLFDALILTVSLLLASRHKKNTIRLTNKRITGIYYQNLFKKEEIDYTLKSVKKIKTNSFMGNGSITIKFSEGILSTFWICFKNMENVNIFKNKFFEIVEK